MKDNFSTQSAEYAQFRPTYPKEVFDFILSFVKEKDIAWDCATGNGQVARELAKHFKQVFGTDISENQLKNAARLDNISYLKEPSEHSSFNDSTFDLITVAQAIHWFQFDAFYAEVKRTLKPGGIFAALGYTVMQIDEKVDVVITKLYDDILGKYWDEERRYIEQQYKTIPFPFEEMTAPSFFIKASWNFEQLIGYLNTWSSLQHYKKANGSNPLELIHEDLKKAWGADLQKAVQFPILLRIGR
ncbi:class I SAM-dependent methyltransferase [Pedobacter metabolipauper]|uniref:Ubiquinone/menaquinone biosynthesis C-methylase UbiE n=1 Tax=Pedobacter metabolipauper TaxID=425513 RepID=A0A4R6SUW2_9SPHI|nr:class I SAM-dependent methyltransferase [Pedobacter metabolipauper]TDQ08803.1 ubiquinone/menaquinone biosynthesis C-methylase UbiE [Pedobacter metabolipauper]